MFEVSRTLETWAQDWLHVPPDDNIRAWLALPTANGGWGLPCYEVLAPAHRLSALLHNRSFRQLDHVVGAWSADERDLILHLQGYLQGDIHEWFKQPAHILQGHGFAKAARTLMRVHANQLREQLSNSPFARWMIQDSDSSPVTSLQASFATALCHLASAEVAPLPDAVFQHFVSTRFETLQVPADAKCANLHHGARRPCGATLSRIHAYNCCRKEIGERHSALAWCWQRLCEQAGWRAYREQAVLVWKNEAIAHKRADVYAVASDGTQHALDVKVVSGDGELATLLLEGEKAKLSEYSCPTGILPEGVKLAPLVAHAKGFLSPHSCMFLLELQRALIDKSLQHGEEWTRVRQGVHAFSCLTLARALAMADFKLWKQASPAS